MVLEKILTAKLLERKREIERGRETVERHAFCINENDKETRRLYTFEKSSYRVRPPLTMLSYTRFKN